MIKDKINRTVFELWVGILIYGILCQFIVLLVKDKIAFSICLWSGIVCAILSAFHMWWSLERALDLDEGGAIKNMRVQFVIRYFVLVLVLGAMGVIFGSYVLATFLGIVGVKASAYIHFITHRISTMIYGEEILPPVIENLYEYEELQNTADGQGKGGE